MPRSTDRIQVDIRGDRTGAQRIREALTKVSKVKTDSGTEVEVVVLPSGSAPSDDCPLVVLGPDDERTMLAAVEDGAMGYVLSTSTTAELESALETVANGVAVVPPMMLGSLLRHAVSRRKAVDDVRHRLAVLTVREREVVEQLSLGKQRRDIARHLFISPETVRTHIQRAMSKLEVHSQTELMALIAPLELGEK